jgi:hypothetical protein
MGCCIIIVVSDSHHDQIIRDPAVNDEQLQECKRAPHLKQNLIKIGLFLLVTLDVFWIGYILGALVAFDQSNIMMGWFILIAGGFASFVFWFSIRWLLVPSNPTCRFGWKLSMLIFLMVTIIGGVILTISLWLKNQLIENISISNPNIPYLAVLIVCLAFLLSIISLVPPIHNLANLPGTTPFSRDNRLWLVWVTILVVLGEFLGVRTLTTTNFFSIFNVTWPLGIFGVIGLINILIYYFLRVVKARSKLIETPQTE